jgi:hypothetical protein
MDKVDVREPNATFFSGYMFIAVAGICCKQFEDRAFQHKSWEVFE